MTTDQPLPEAPSGYEYLNLIWSLLVPAADAYVAVLPQSADPAWATEHGLSSVAVSLFKQGAARDALNRTPGHSTLRRVRARHLRLLEKQFECQALAVLGAIADQVRTRHPTASSAQLLMATRDAFRALQRAAFPADGAASAHHQG